MREIKFRAWDPIEKEMLFVRFEDLLEGCRPASFISGINRTRLDWMEYTGLKCYNGKEWSDVYEDDILFKHGRHMVIEWVGINLTKRIKTPKGDRNYLFTDIDFKEEDGRKLHGYQLVGNRHENPELLEVK